MRDATLFIIAILGLAVVLFFLLQWLSSYSCQRLGQEAEVPTKYSMAVGCLVKIDNSWIPSDQWRALK